MLLRFGDGAGALDESEQSHGAFYTRDPGQIRAMYRTQNPKNYRWNKPKASTYSAIIVLYLDEKEHIQAAHLSPWDNAEKVATFVEMFGEHLTEEQWKTIRYLGAVTRVASRVTWKVSEPGETTQTPEEQNKILAAMIAQELRNPTPA